MYVTQKPKLEPAARIFELGQPSPAVPVGKTIKASINTLASEKEADKNQYAMNMGTEWTSLHQYQPHAQKLKQDHINWRSIKEKVINLYNRMYTLYMSKKFFPQA
jgi:hypothetical protein